MTTIRLEAEYMNRTTYRLDGGVGFDFISNTFAVGLPGGSSNTETGTITTPFGGESGTYDIIVGYFDEDDGIANYTLNLEGALVSTWQGTNTTGGSSASPASFTTQIISNYSVNNGDVIELIGTEDLNEPARVDYIDFVLTGSTSLPDIAGSNGIIEIMPLGDSVTKGTDPSIPDAEFNGYRDNLETLLANGGFNSDLVGGRNHGVGFDTDHEGWGGFTINQISNNVETWLGANPPEIVLLTIGTNDMRSTSTPVPDVIDKLAALVDKIMGLAPYSRLIVSSIPPVNTNIPGNTALFAQRVTDFNLAIPGIINARSAAGRLISYVDAFGSIDAVANMSSDGFHPNESGYTLAANTFYSEIQTIAGSGSSTTPTSGNDILTGTAGADTIDGLGGDDIINGLGGADNLIGNAGNDTIDGGAGSDTIDGNAGNDVLYGGNNNDVINGDGGADIIDGGTGMDTINGGADNDTIQGGQGNDTINGGQGNDTINGDQNDDILDGANGNDILNGGDGNDTVRGGNGRDTLSGGLGADNIVGGNTKDFLFGDEGNDRLDGNGGFDELTGGEGNDLLRGQAGDDLLIGVDPTEANPGTGEVDKLLGGLGADTFVLGDANSVFYVGLGSSDYGSIRDFDAAENDVIQLSGSSSDYSLQTFGGGTRIFSDNGVTTDLVGVAKGVSFTDFSSGFSFIP